jgi:hypothetical protein
MQIYIKNRSIERKAKIANYLMYAGPILLVGIFILSFSYPESTTILGIAALISFVVSQYGIILKNRWGKRPRIDEIIDQSLKGLDSKFTIFHYELGANHALISPSGIFALVPVILDGKITFEDGKWWQIKKSLGRERKKRQNKITTDAEFELRALSRSLQKKLNPSSCFSTLMQYSRLITPRYTLLISRNLSPSSENLKKDPPLRRTKSQS